MKDNWNDRVEEIESEVAKELSWAEALSRVETRVLGLRSRDKHQFSHNSIQLYNCLWSEIICNYPIISYGITSSLRTRHDWPKPLSGLTVSQPVTDSWVSLWPNPDQKRAKASSGGFATTETWRTWYYIYIQWVINIRIFVDISIELLLHIWNGIRYIDGSVFRLYIWTSDELVANVAYNGCQWLCQWLCQWWCQC